VHQGDHRAASILTNPECTVQGFGPALEPEGGMNLSSDSKTYLVAGNLLRHGMLERATQKVFPDHAPFYPLVLGLAQSVSGGALNVREWGVSWREPVVQRVPWARWVSILSFALTVAGIFLLGRHLDGSFGPHLSAILALIFPPLVRVFTWAWSETLFLPISIFCLLALFQYNRKRNNFWLLFSALLAGLTFFTRFMGISMVLSGAVIILLTTQNRKQLIKVVLWSLIACFPLLIYLTIERAMPAAQHGFFHQISEFLKVCFRDLGSIGVTVLLLALLFEIIRWRVAGKVRMWWGPALYVFVYSAILVVVSSVTSIDPLDSHGSRLVVPIYPFLLLLVSSTLAELYRTKKEQLTGAYSRQD
jgi:4-amino-4-deoxy-L-arabinose transferase-like glycosyltransferase